MAVLATELASRGVVVFVTDYGSLASVADAARFTECGYRFSLDVADHFGGDLSQPVTMGGYSLGATAVLYHGLDENEYGPDGYYDECFSGAPRPDVVVGINGCYVGSGFPSALGSWGNPDADFVLLYGSEDTNCGPTESEAANDWLQSKGYSVDLVEVADANHWQVVFHDNVDGEYLTLPADDPAGQATVQAILDAIEAAQQ
jgi:hypothetical protein